MVNIQPNILTKVECREIIKNSLHHLTPALVVKPDDPIPTRHPDRVADAWFVTINPPIIQKIKQIVSDITGLPIEKQEPPNIVRYQKGGEYKIHADYHENVHNISEGVKQRRFSCLFYLNDDFEGGGTDFPRIGFQIKPPSGTLISWENTDSEGEPYRNSIHAGLPVLSGEKFILIIWVNV
jgi:prolyl 4-hydroxylase